MYDVYLIFRSVTHGQEGKTVLNRARISSSLTRSPSKLSQNGCAYALCIRPGDWAEARGLLREAGRKPQAVWLRQADGSFRRLE